MMSTSPAAVAAATDVSSSQRLRELIDEVARKDSALQEFRTLFERLCKDYETEQRNSARAKMELETLRTRHETQQQELTAVKAKCTLQEAKLKEEDSAWERRTRQLRQELSAAVEERDAAAKEREAQWQQSRTLRAQLEEQQRQHTEAEDAWRQRLEEARTEAEEKVRCGMREREELLRLREMELQRGSSQLEGRLADASAEMRRQKETNDALVMRIEDIQSSLRRQEGMTQRLQDALNVEQKEKAQLGEYITLERQTYRQRLEQTENSYKAQVQEMQRLCDQQMHERHRLESELARCQRESQQEAQRTREAWLQQKQQLEATIDSLRGDLTRARMRSDSADESHQRVEALLVRTRRELEASQQQEAVLQETITSLHKAAAKRDATQVRLEGEITRLIAAVAERERETERWRTAVDRMEWQSRLEAARDEMETERLLPEPLPPPPPPLSSFTSTTTPATRRGLARRSVRVTPNRPQQQQQQQAESIDYTPSTGSPHMTGNSNNYNNYNYHHPSHVSEDKDAAVLRSIVQEVLQGCMTQTEPSYSSYTHTSNAAAAARPFSAMTGDRHTRTPRRRNMTDTRRAEETLPNGMPSPSPIVRDTSPRDCKKKKDRRHTAATREPTLVPAPLPSTTSSTNSSILQAAAPLFASSSNTTYLDFSNVSQPPKKWQSSSNGHNGAASHISEDSPLSAPLATDGIAADDPATSALIAKYTREREETEQQMRQTLRDLEHRQQQLLLSSVQNGSVATPASQHDAPLRLEQQQQQQWNGGSAAWQPNSSGVSSSSSTAATGNASSSARASTAAPAPPSRLLRLQERFATMPMAQ